jgi:hypothetical protein
MRLAFAVVALSAFVGLPMVSPAAFAQQNTVRACQDQWRANRAANQAAGITEKDYVEKCRAGKAAAAPTAAAPTAAAPAAAAPAAAPSKAAPPKPAAKTAAPSTTSPATVGVAKPTSPAPAAANQFSNAALAKAHCAGDSVVWANLGSRIYHFSGARDYGNTKQGAYMCERDAVAQGIRAAKNEKHP